MSLFDWFAETRSRANEVHRREVQNVPPQYQEREIPDGLWHKCSACSVLTYIKDLRTNLMVCPECGHHNQVSAPDRIAQLLDPGSWVEINAQLTSSDPLEFRDRKPYSDRLKEYQQKTGLEEGILTGAGTIEGNPTALAIMDFRFMGGSMGSAVGEKIARLIEFGTQKRLPVILFCASGGARMQEGILSLMQMAKTSGALERHRREKLLYIPVLTNPTTGGVTASFAMLGDIILAEPKAMIGFTGRRVIEQTLKQKIPDDFQSAEYLLGHGFVDSVVPRTKLKSTLSMILSLHASNGNSSSDAKLDSHPQTNTKPVNLTAPSRQ
jgi:acetyl-CoA carboxylase carboxyl transferase subunit beta